MTDKASFIRQVTKALGRSEILPPEANCATAIFEDRVSAAASAEKAVADAVSLSENLIGQMAQSAETAGWKVHRIDTLEMATELVVDICKDQKATSVLRSTHSVLTDIPLDAALSATGTTVEVTKHTSVRSIQQIQKSKSVAFSADVGITGVDYAIAETGTVVLHPRAGVSRLLSLAPPTHIAILRPGEVLMSLDELFAIQRDDFFNGELQGSMNLISGPSRTADIEGTTVTGIHGPLEVHLIIVENNKS
ncbi:MAG: lactate utilization protein [Dehalococcoidia bacterium]|jgi:L-lactate dehydrogenase complex protein LldG|nr:lactate utilization protein [Dehalococcoidia bacterium]|tara:strand:- start:1221 stop:1970 length:750 start_codon:yes stop_codon:yes gene_type:complete